MTEQNLISLPEQWSDWHIESTIGGGAYGTVFKASKTWQADKTEITQISAIKVITLPAQEDEAGMMQELSDRHSAKAYYANLVQDFVREIQLMISLKSHPHIVAIDDFAVEEAEDGIGWKIFIRMEFLESFYEYSSQHVMTEKEVLRLGIEMCRALEFCHGKQIIHRDIKPANILVSEGGSFKLGDFGVSRKLGPATNATMKTGTDAFMAPEVSRGGQYGMQADLYSLGLVLYKLLNKNRDPFVSTEKKLIYARDKQEALERRMNGEVIPKPVDASDEMAAVIGKACEYDPRDRYASAEKMREDLEAVLAGVQVQTAKSENVKAPETEEVKTAKETDTPARLQVQSSVTGKKRKKAIPALLAGALLAAVAGGFGLAKLQKKTAIVADAYEISLDMPENEKLWHEAEQFIEEFDAQLWRYLAEGDEAGLNRLYHEHGLDENTALDIDLFKELFFNEECDQTCVSMLCETGNEFYGEAIHYYLENDFLDEESRAMTYPMMYYVSWDGEWTVHLDPTPELAERIIGLMPPDWQEGSLSSNAAQFECMSIVTDRLKLKGAFQPSLFAAWQKEDGEVELIFSLYNGTDNVRQTEGVHIRLVQGTGGVIVDTDIQLPIRECEPGVNFPCKVTIPADKVYSEKEEWQAPLTYEMSVYAK